MSPYRGGETWRAGLSAGRLIVVTLIIVSVAIALVWWLWSVFVNPLPYSDPEAIAAATTQGN